MTFPPVGSQALYLYPCKWDSSKDKLLLACLIGKIEECRPSPPHLSPHVLMHAMMTLNSKLNADVSLDEVEGRVAFLQDRYVSFKYLCNRKDTQYDENDNVVYAVDEVWERLFKENALLRAYYHAGEPEFLQMCGLFGMYDVKTELSHTLILIEDSSTVKKEAGSSDDEVTSPIPKPVCRKLFVDDASSSIAPAGGNPSKMSATFSWNSLKNKFKRPASHAAKRNDDGQPSTTYGGSSCASSSPFK